jgi:hypothetical protein
LFNIILENCKISCSFNSFEKKNYFLLALVQLAFILVFSINLLNSSSLIPIFFKSNL